ncbi:hypothetical protein Hanom_Chr17g01576111 [Helianthus anomalus]
MSPLPLDTQDIIILCIMSYGGRNRLPFDGSRSSSPPWSCNSLWILFTVCFF